MGWSTREVADLAGTTLRTVRHYHDLGLLPEPQRSANGYKQYGVDHLVRVLRIRRLTELGMSLQQLVEAHDLIDRPHDVLARVAVDVRETIARLEEVRSELDFILESSAAVDVPPPLALVIADDRLPEPDRKLLVVLGRLLTPESAAALAEAMETLADDPAAREFDALAADADPDLRRDLAERMVPGSIELHQRMPDLMELKRGAPGRPSAALRSLHTAVDELYNPAQVEVVHRMAELRVAAIGV
jgi:DNA-binding transcriptional MerR regulator